MNVVIDDRGRWSFVLTEEERVCNMDDPRVFSVCFDEYINNLIANILSVVEHKYILWIILIYSSRSY